VVEHGVLAQYHEQFDPGASVGLWHVDDEGVDDFFQGQHGAVDLAGAHPHPAAVDGGVGAPVDDRGAAVGDLDPVAVPPHPRVHGEVAVAEPAAVLVPPEVEGHGRGGTGHHELPDFAYEFVACAVPGGHCHAEGAGLDLSLVDGQGGHPA